MKEEDFDPLAMLRELQAEGYENGFTVRAEDFTVLMADRYTPCIPYRRSLHSKKSV